MLQNFRKLNMLVERAYHVTTPTLNHVVTLGTLSLSKIMKCVCRRRKKIEKTDLFVRGYVMVLAITGLNCSWWSHYIHPMAPSIINIIQLNKFFYLNKRDPSRKTQL